MLSRPRQIRFTWESPLSIPGSAPTYMGEGYQSLLATHDCSEARLLSCHVGDQSAWMPMLVREVANGTHEAYSAYGYGGLFGDLKLTEEDSNGLRTQLADAGIIALFLRHSPFLENQSAMPDGLTRINRHTYAATLRVEATFADYLARAPQKLRWSANYALRAGLRVAFYPLRDCPDGKIKAFYAQYAALMTDKGTSNYYRFSEQFFLDHARRLGDHCELAEVTDKEGRFLAGAFFLLDRDGWVHYHLSSAHREAMKAQGMELLMLSALHRYGNAGYKALHLGGGHSLDESDGLSRFKSKFADRKLEFHCSTLICDTAAYSCERARLPLARPSFFLISDARGMPPASANSSLERLA